MADLFTRLQAALADRYTIERELGRGGMATVYLARDLKHDRAVAIKVLHPELAGAIGVERFLREIKLAARLQHPHILPLHDSGEAEGFLYYVMPYVEGESLRHRLVREKQFPLEDALRIAREVADALSYAHSHGVMHRDIKPENILVSGGVAVVADFGIARAITAAAGETLTETGIAVGTPAYMSPEQAAGERQLDGRSDIYSLGCVLYEMLAGHPPFLGATAQEVLARHTLDPVPPLRTARGAVSEAVERAVMKALAKAPADRFATGQEFIAALTSGLAPTRTRRRPARRTVALTAGTALVVVSLAAGWLMLAGRERAAPATFTHKQLTFSGQAYSPVISPDGKLFVYASDSELLVQDVAGGQPITVHHVSRGLPLQWSPDASEILLSQFTDSSVAIFLVPVLGGTPRRIWQQLDPRPPISASWSPDGSRIAVRCENKLCLINKWTGESSSIAVDTSFDWMADLDWSGKGGLIVFASKDRRARSAIWTIAPDGGTQRKVVEDSLALSSPRWSPAGDAIYYLRGEDQTRELWKIRVSPGTGRPKGRPFALATGVQPGRSLALSGDGKRLLYTREVAYPNLWLVTVGDRGRDKTVRTRQLTTGTLGKWGPSVSPNGERVAFSMGDGTKANIYVMPMEGGPMRQITFFNAFSSGPVWSPDGREIAFGSTQGGAPKVWTVAADGGDPRRFVRTELDHNFSGASKFQLAWSPESEILYQRGSVNFRVVNPVTEEERWLVGNDSVGRGMGSPRFSPDGRKVAVRWWRPSPSLWLISRADLSQVLLHSYRQDWFELIGWSADGRWIYVADTETGKPRIARILVAGGESETVATLPFEPGLWASMTADGKRFVFEVWQAQSDVWMLENFEPENR